ncbi:hypothetical protein GCM10010221_32630 [Streptomyces parvus]|nr:hypothetical protein GCM10010221_32630 [Streptomyces parvus]
MTKGPAVDLAGNILQIEGELFDPLRLSGDIERHPTGERAPVDAGPVATSGRGG